MNNRTFSKLFLKEGDVFRIPAGMNECITCGVATGTEMLVINATFELASGTDTADSWGVYAVPAHQVKPDGTVPNDARHVHFYQGRATSNCFSYHGLLPVVRHMTPWRSWRPATQETPLSTQLDALHRFVEDNAQAGPQLESLREALDQIETALQS